MSPQLDGGSFEIRQNMISPPSLKHKCNTEQVVLSNTLSDPHDQQILVGRNTLLLPSLYDHPLLSTELFTSLTKFSSFQVTVLPN